MDASDERPSDGIPTVVRYNERVLRLRACGAPLRMAQASFDCAPAALRSGDGGGVTSFGLGRRYRRL